MVTRRAALFAGAAVGALAFGLPARRGEAAGPGSFEDGPEPMGLRHRIDGVAMALQPAAA